MATRDVQIRLTSSGLEALIAKFDILEKKLDAVMAKVTEMDLKLDRLSHKEATPTVELKGADEALAKLAMLKAGMDSLGGSNASFTGGGNDALSKFMYNSLYRPDSGGNPFTGNDMLSLRRILSSEAGSISDREANSFFDSLFRPKFGDGAFTGRDQADLLKALGPGHFGSGRGGGFLNSILRLFGGGSGGGLASTAAADAASGGGGGGGLAGIMGSIGPIAIGSLVALAAAVAPSIIPLALGGAIGGAGVFGAYTLGSKANTQLTALQASLKGTTGTQRVKIEEQIAAFKKQNAPALSAYGAFSRLGQNAEGTFFGAITSGGHDSFLSGLTGILDQVGTFVKSIGPQLGEVFRASLPFIRGFVTVLEQAAKVLLPAFTQALNALKPSLPTIEHGFILLAQGIAYFIKDLGPGMKDSAIVFMTTMNIIKGLLIAAAAIVNFVASAFRDIASVFKATGLAAYHMVLDIYRWLARANSDIGHWVDNVIRFIGQVIKWFQGLPAKIAHALGNLPSLLFDIGKRAVEGLIHGLESIPVLGPVISWSAGIIGHISGALGVHSPSTVMRGIGRNIGLGLALGMDDAHGAVLSAAARLTGGIGHGVAGSIGSSARPAIPIELTLRLSDDLMQVISNQVRVKGGDPRIFIKKVKFA